MNFKPLRSLLLVCALLFGCLTESRAQGTAFTYQGRLSDGGAPANGSYDLRFGLYTPGNALVGTYVTNGGVAVANGQFTATLDFGNVFNGSPYLLDIAVRTNGSVGAFTALTPRQPITPTPYAIYAANSAAASAVTPNSVTTAGIQDAAITAAKVAGGQVVKSLNGLTDGVTLSAGSNVTITTNSNNLQISASSAGVGFAQQPQITTAGAADDLLINTSVGGGNYTTHRINAQNLLFGANLGPVMSILGGSTVISAFSNTPPQYVGQLGIAQNGGSWPYLMQSFSATGPDHVNPNLGGKWCGGFRFMDISQWGDSVNMASNAIGNTYAMQINGFPQQDIVHAAKSVLNIQNHQTNAASTIQFFFANANNFSPGHVGGEIGVANGGSDTGYNPTARSNAMYVASLAGVPLVFTMQDRVGGGPNPGTRVAYFDAPSTDFHYMSTAGSNALWIKAADGSVQMDGNLTVNGTISSHAAATTYFTNASAVNITPMPVCSIFIITNSGGICNITLPDPAGNEGLTRTIKQIGATGNGVNIANGGVFGDTDLPGELSNTFCIYTNKSITFQVVSGKWWAIAER